jgi:hypothetical protein
MSFVQRVGIADVTEAEMKMCHKEVSHDDVN